MTFEIIIHENEYGACPGCGAYWGHSEPKLNWTNRQKVDDYWRCYNPACIVAFYDPERKRAVELEYTHRCKGPCDCVPLEDCSWKWIETRTFGKFYVPVCPNCKDHQYDDNKGRGCGRKIIYNGYETGSCMCRSTDHR